MHFPGQRLPRNPRRVSTAAGDAWEKVGNATHKRMVGRLVPLGMDAVVLVGGADGKGNVAAVEVIRLAERGEVVTAGQ